MPSAAAAAADKTANADAGPSPPKKQDTGKGRGRALQLSVKTSVRRRGVARYDSTVALSGNAVNFEPPLGYDDSYAYSREPLKISDGETLHVIYRRVACPVFPALPAAVDNATQRLHPRHITKKVFKYIFEVAGTDTDSGEILHQVMAACRAHCLHNSIFSDAALIEEANLHLRAAGACRLKTHFSIESNFLSRRPSRTLSIHRRPARRVRGAPGRARPRRHRLGRDAESKSNSGPLRPGLRDLGRPWTGFCRMGVKTAHRALTFDFSQARPNTRSAAARRRPLLRWAAARRRRRPPR